MAAGLGFKTFVNGDVLTAGDTNGYLMQGVLVFASAAARDSAITSPQEGQFAYLKDTDVTTYYSGSAWTAIGGASGGMTLIQETVASANSGIDFNSIPGTYKQLLLVWSGINHSAVDNTFVLRANSNSSNDYSQRFFYATGSNTVVYGIQDSNSFGPATFGTDVRDTAIMYSSLGSVLIDNYASSSKYKTFFSNYAYNDSGTNYFQYVLQGSFDSQTAITTLNIVRTAGAGTISNEANTSIRLYGIA